MSNRKFLQGKLNTEQSSIRLPLWDNLKAMLIFLVVLGHFLALISANCTIAGYINLYIYTFHMPLFIFISGLFAKNDRLDVAKSFSYLFLYLVLTSTTFLFRGLLNYNSFPSENIDLFGSNHLQWYLIAMAAYPMITFLLKDIKPRIVLLFSFVLASFVGYDENVGSFLFLSKLISFFPFYYVGTLLTSEEFINLKKNRNLRIIAGGLLVLFALFIAVFGGIYGRFSQLLFLNQAGIYYSLPLPFFGAVYRIAYYIAVGFIGLAIILVIPNRGGVFTYIGQRTLQIYFLHIFIYIVFEQCSGKLFIDMPEILEILVVVLISAIVTLVLSSKIFEKPFKATFSYNRIACNTNKNEINDE